MTATAGTVVTSWPTQCTTQWILKQAWRAVRAVTAPAVVVVVVVAMVVVEAAMQKGDA